MGKFLFGEFNAFACRGNLGVSGFDAVERDADVELDLIAEIARADLFLFVLRKRFRAAAIAAASIK